MINEVTEFIDNFKKGFNVEALEESFSHGNCYHFAITLYNVFPHSEIVHEAVDNHFMIKYNNVFYDINGIVENVNESNIQTLRDLKLYDVEYYENLMRDCAYLKTR